MTKEKRGIALIVLAGTIIISLSNTGIIDKSQEAYILMLVKI